MPEHSPAVAAGESLRFVALATTRAYRARLAELPPACETARSLPPILVIPGWLGDISRFLDFGRKLARIGRVWIWEPHGFGASAAPHRRGLFDAASYVAELELLLRALEARDREFVILGSSSGATLALHYVLDGRGPRPFALALLSPQLAFRVPPWFGLIDRLPSGAARAAQAVILRLLRSYLRIASPAEARNIEYAIAQLARSDDWTMRRFFFEYMKPCSLEERVSGIDVPVIAFAARRDWFASHPQPGLLRVPGSRLEMVESGAHRFHEGREAQIADRLGAALASLPGRAAR